MPTGSQAWVLLNIQHAIHLNTMLALFNLIPIPLMDGSRGIDNGVVTMDPGLASGTDGKALYATFNSYNDYYTEYMVPDRS